MKGLALCESWESMAGQTSKQTYNLNATVYQNRFYCLENYLVFHEYRPEAR